MSETYPKSASAKRFVQNILPFSVRIGCKGSELFWIEQEKSPFKVFFLTDK